MCLNRLTRSISHPTMKIRSYFLAACKFSSVPMVSTSVSRVTSTARCPTSVKRRPWLCVGSSLSALSTLRMRVATKPEKKHEPVRHTSIAARLLSSLLPDWPLTVSLRNLRMHSRTENNAEASSTRGKEGYKWKNKLFIAFFPYFRAMTSH